MKRPNTKIKLEDLNQEQLSRILDISESAGIGFSNDSRSTLDPESIKRDILGGRFGGELEFRPALESENKISFGRGFRDDGKGYLHVEVYPNDPSDDSRTEEICSAFYKQLEEEFGPR
jgi:hypothetical protein